MLGIPAPAAPFGPLKTLAEGALPSPPVPRGVPGRTHHSDEARGARPEPAGKTSVGGVNGGRGLWRRPCLPAPRPRSVGPIAPHPPPATPSTQDWGPQIASGADDHGLLPHSPRTVPETHVKRREAKRAEKEETSASGQLNHAPEEAGYGVCRGSRNRTGVCPSRGSSLPSSGLD